MGRSWSDWPASGCMAGSLDHSMSAGTWSETAHRRARSPTSTIDRGGNIFHKFSAISNLLAVFTHASVAMCFPIQCMVGYVYCTRMSRIKTFSLLCHMFCTYVTEEHKFGILENRKFACYIRVYKNNTIKKKSEIRDCQNYPVVMKVCYISTCYNGSPLYNKRLWHHHFGDLLLGGKKDICVGVTRPTLKIPPTLDFFFFFIFLLCNFHKKLHNGHRKS